MTTMISWLCLVVTGLTTIGDCARILLLPIQHHPHVKSYALVGKHLADVGHEVMLLTLERHRETLDKIGVPYMLHYTVKSKSVSQEAGQQGEIIFFGGKLSTIKAARLRLETICRQCEDMLESEELIKTLENKKFDIAIVDSFDIFRCLYVLPYRLDIPYITLTMRHDPWSARLPALPSIEGHQGVLGLTKTCSFIDRLLNTFVYISFYSLSLFLSDDSLITRFAPNKPPTTLSQLHRNSEIILVNMETTCLDGPRMSAPHYQFVGVVGNRPAQPLSKPLETFMNSAENGVIVVSFGSIIKFVPPELFDKLMAGFRQVDQRVIMRFQGTLSKRLPSNLKILDWLPQNDLLGHNKTRLFITHAGNNGRMEATYHGVPMLCLPLYGDQTANAKQIVDRGFGLRLDWSNFTADDLVNSIEEIMNNPIYAQNIQKCSQLQQESPNPHKTIVFWVEHILKFGSSHLRPSHLQMPLWKFFMLDIVLVFTLFLLGGMFLVFRCWRYAVRKCFRKTSKQKTD